MKSNYQAMGTELSAVVMSETFKRLQSFALDDNFLDKLQLAFGSTFSNDAAADLQQAWADGDYSELPNIEIRVAAEINGANGAFSTDTNTIYLSQELISFNAANPETIVQVLLEEIGHFIDSQLNSVDSPGDEGAIFSALVLGQELSPSALQQLKAEDDTAIINLDGQLIQIEQAEIIGGPGDEVLNGSNGDDTILGGGGDDTINGGAGNDSIDGGTGIDSIDGGSGNDTIVGGGSGFGFGDSINNPIPTDSVNGDEGTDLLIADYSQGVRAIFLTNLLGVPTEVLVEFGVNVTTSGSSALIQDDPPGSFQEFINTEFYSSSEFENFDITGTNLNDSLIGGTNADTLIGGGGDDTIVGSDGNNTIDGGDGNDTIESGAGDDTIDAGDGNDTIESGAGDDTIDAGDGNNTIDGGDGNNNIESGAGDDIISSGAGDDIITSSGGNDTIDAGEGNDTVNAGLASGIADGGEGTDLLVVDFSELNVGITMSSSFITAGSSNFNFVHVNFENFDITGTNQADSINGDASADTLNGGDGDDTLDGFGGNDVIDGGAGDDLLIEADFSSTTDALNIDDTSSKTINTGGLSIANIETIENLLTGSGDDTINYVNFRDYSIDTGAGDDVINTGAGDDVIRAGEGNDTVNAGLGSGTADGGEGTDLLIADFSELNVGITMSSSFITGGNTTFVHANFENFDITGTNQADSINGDASADTLNGGDGDDTLDGFGGNDVIDGGAGDDLLIEADFSSTTDALNIDDTSSKTINTGGLSIANIETIENLLTGSGDDTINYVNFRDYSIDTGAGDDVINTGAGDDVIRAGEGNDTVNAGLGSNTADGGEGTDLLVADFSDLISSGITMSSSFITGGNTTSVNANFENFDITGTNQADSLKGDANADTLNGGDGDDTLDGFGGNDVIDGGAGDDLINLGADTDTDTVTYNLGDGTDTINQFVRGVGGDILSFNGFQGVDVVSFNDRTQFHAQDGASFGEGTLLITLVNTIDFTSDDLGINLTSSDGTQFRFENSNDPPVAVDDAFTIAEDTTTAVLDLLGNDTDLDGDTLSIESIVGIALTPGTAQSIAVTNGTVNVSATGDITFTPDANYNGSVSFDYVVTDGTATDTGTVNITVNPVNDAPIAADDTVTTDEDVAVVIDAALLLGNDTDIDGDTLSIGSVTDPSNGTLVDNNDGTYTYTPDANYTGPDAFTYTISDGNGGTDTATVNITVRSTNDPPVAVDDAVTTDEDVAITGNVLDGSSGGLDTDLDGDTLSVIDNTDPSNGTVSISANGDFTYTPNPDFFGTDSFGYTISDGNGGTSVATVNITVNPVNDAPIAADDTVTTDEDVAVVIDAALLLGNDTDIDGDTLSIDSVTTPSNGTLVDNNDGTYTYTPDANYTGSDAFTYTISDGNGGTDTATVNITVGSTNDIATVTDDSGSVTEDDDPNTLTTSGQVIVTDSDPGEAFATAETLIGTYGTFTVDADGFWNYTADNTQAAIQELGLGESLTETFSVTSLDGTGAGTVTITINGLNELLEGTSQADFLLGTGLADTINGRGGNDTLIGRGDNDILNGDGGRDTLEGRNGDDILNGGSGADSLNGGNGLDTLNGGNGRDTLDGGNNSDILDGGNGADTYLWDAGDDRDIYQDTGTTGTDRITSLVENFNGLTATFDATSGIEVINREGDLAFNIRGAGTVGETWDFTDINLTNATIQGRGGDDNITGSNRADIIEGNRGNDTLNGGSGNDSLLGGGNDDVLTGGDGRDTLVGGSGADSLNGGAGNDLLQGNGGDDTFIFAGDFGRDTVVDFNGNADQIDLSSFAIGISDIDTNGDGVIDSNDANARLVGGNLRLNLASLGGGRITFDSITSIDEANFTL
ncbi:tandem-95 repeat protein [Acaryochloris marina]|uniref:Cadherin-like domain-containing protein n=1 Tax=Acaryochloris marina (strain MBIC 11017) TaxID=329726 RepID=A8ZPE1_ACAM1|nr:Ig-like domain-containing protein [Acaryochloris marina]ABW32877.1 conserved hypothetical protein [Acaryochloris marina MBIC11017]